MDKRGVPVHIATLITGRLLIELLFSDRKIGRYMGDVCLCVVCTVECEAILCKGQ